MERRSKKKEGGIKGERGCREEGGEKEGSRKSHPRNPEMRNEK